jgi:SAM-dependent methyltransferase
MLNQFDKKKLIENYRKLFIENNEGPAVGQWSPEGQLFRFEKLSEIGPMKGKRVLEIGCGIGDFYPFLKEKFDSVNYTGIDIVPELVNYAKHKYPEATFHCLDLHNVSFEDKFDYVLISGVFNNEIDKATDFLFSMISIAFEICEKGIGFNFTSKYVNRFDKDMAYHDPTDVFKFILEKLSKKVILSHHYERCDVAVFVYR